MFREPQVVPPSSNTVRYVPNVKLHHTDPFRRGLAISDFLMAVNFLSSTAMNISGRFIGSPKQSTFCTFNGFVTQVFVIQTDYWVFLIAFCTYVILADHKNISAWVQAQRIFLSCLPWTFSLLWAGIGLRMAGYGDIGACMLVSLVYQVHY